DAILARFATEGGGLALTGANSEMLLYRPRDYADAATPSAAGVAVQVFIALGHLLADPKYLDAAEAVVRAAWRDVERAPAAHPTLLVALEELLDPPPLVVLRGEHTGRWATPIARACPRARLLRLGGESGLARLQRYARRGATAAYVCRGTACSAPIDNETDLL